jgi:hypothetical protein
VPGNAGVFITTSYIGTETPNEEFDAIVGNLRSWGSSLGRRLEEVAVQKILDELEQRGVCAIRDGAVS